MTISRRQLCSTGAAFAVVGLAGCLSGGDESAEGSGDDWTWSGSLPVESVVQHHDPDCGCCSAYVEYLDDHGIDVQVEETRDLEGIKRDLSVPEDAWSCHTIEFGDYLVEGHVPLEAIETLFEDEPAVLGITAPGMPQHSPGMGPPGDEPLTIYSFEESGETAAYVDV
ncbi:metal-binding protein [Natronococcus pandeyae]|uniref:Metal-binding protein n=1 Tax=Natronococcus pandeyae TaxID=2055836 RepID=A0A8J8Q8F9_9EURY|nr:DUF411 domain-containing protein [Natronococcus pandeyae]TYL39105.1 metal-binding protein [Natronococcus pandeyae]